MATGGIIDKPTIVEVAENGREAIIPLERNTGWINEIARRLNSASANNTTGSDLAMLDKLDRIYERINRMKIVLDSGALVGETIEQIDAGLADRQILKEMGL
jgi:SLT domain-containing protein